LHCHAKLLKKITPSAIPRDETTGKLSENSSPFILINLKNNNITNKLKRKQWPCLLVCEARKKEERTNLSKEQRRTKRDIP
jgi:hypothetical protein